MFGWDAFIRFGIKIDGKFRLRVKDIDFGCKQVVVRNPKGEKDRTTMLPEKVIEPLKGHLKKIKKIHEEDLKNGYGAVYLYLMQ